MCRFFQNILCRDKDSKLNSGNKLLRHPPHREIARFVKAIRDCTSLIFCRWVEDELVKELCLSY